jgi:ATP synthase protein I
LLPAPTTCHPTSLDSDDQETGAGSWSTGAEAQAFKPLTKEEASALRAKEPPLSPWRVVAVQVMVGVAAALLAGLLTQRQEVVWSVLYGAATVVVPGALMARGMTSRISSMSPGSSAVSFMLWASVKIAVSVAMLMLAPSIVQPLVWPALLVGLVLCMKIYVVALLWRTRRKVSN